MKSTRKKLMLMLVLSALSAGWAAEDDWIFDASQRRAPSRSPVATAATSLDSRTAERSVSAATALEARATSLGASSPGPLSTMPPGLTILVR